MDYRELSNEQRRQWLDYQQVADELSRVKESLKTQFSGSMRWVHRGSQDYLHAKKNRSEKSLGPRSLETEEIYQNFIRERSEAKQRKLQLEQKVRTMAPINRALGLGRVPSVASKILRRLHDKGLLGRDLLVVGTMSLFAYEAKAGIQFTSDLLATADTDLLWDARQTMTLSRLGQLPAGLMGILRTVDKSFQKREARDFKAVNSDGFSVDLIRAEDHTFFNVNRDTISGQADDLHGAPVYGLHWLLNAPRLNVLAIAEDGLNVPIYTVDPRAFTLHKLWISDRKDRDPLKASRDRSQALAVADVTRKYLGLDFDAHDLRALPKNLRALWGHPP